MNKKFNILNIQLNTFNILIVLFEILIISSIAYEITILNSVSNEREKAYYNKHEMLKVSNLLRQSSDNLTNSVRNYAVTKDVKYETMYLDVLKIKNGQKKRPKAYNGNYWNLNVSSRKEYHPGIEKKSLTSIIQNLPFSQNELNQLKMSEEKAKDLVDIEVSAFVAIKNDNFKEAINLLYSKEYVQAKHTMMFPINKMIIMLEKRTQDKIKLLDLEVNKQYISISISALMVLLLNLFIYYLLNKKINIPIKYLTEVLHKFRNAKPVKEKKFFDDEVGLMIKEFFLMHNSILKQQDTLDHLNQDLQSIVNEKTADLNAKNSELENLTLTLEKKVISRTQELQDSLLLIKESQNRLVETEKMASLGGLVAGVAHEINTPIGVAVTGASHLLKKYDSFLQLYKNDQVTMETFDSFMAVNEKSIHIILNNLERAASLISSFKSVAVDQSSNDIRQINLQEYLESILMTLNPKLKTTKHKVIIDCKNIIINIAAGVLSQIVTNLIENAIIHAFENIEDGLVTIRAKQVDNNLEFIYEDNGIGMNKETANKFFDPFFTTKRSEGGSGLGTHLIYNLVTQSLNGTISLKTELNQGLKVIILIPLIKGSYV